MKTLIIFTNDGKIEEILGSDTTLSVSQSFQSDGIQIKIVFDKSDEAKLLNDKQPVEPDANKNNENLYFILHKNAQEDYKNNFRDRYPKAHIKVQSHVDGEFYYTYLPKIAKKNFNQKDLEDIFQTELKLTLNFLHQLNNGNIPNLPEDLSEFSGAYNTFKASTNGNKNVFSDDYINALAEFRDAVLDNVIEN